LIGRRNELSVASPSCGVLKGKEENVNKFMETELSTKICGHVTFKL
jgi:hypothetical protein